MMPRACTFPRSTPDTRPSGSALPTPTVAIPLTRPVPGTDMKAILSYRPTASLAVALDQVRQDMEERLQELLANQLVLMEDWEKLTPETKKEILSSLDKSSFFAALVECGLLNSYQASR